MPVTLRPGKTVAALVFVVAVSEGSNHERDRDSSVAQQSHEEKRQAREKELKHMRDTAVFGATLTKSYSTAQDAFDGVDISGDGIIDASELAAAAGDMQYQGEASDLFKDLDTTRDRKITMSEFVKFAKAYMPKEATSLGSSRDVHWSPGYDGQFTNDRPLPSNGAHRRRTLQVLSRTGGQIGITPASLVLWMRLGRTTSLLPAAWVGEYAELGDGDCRTMEGHSPVYTDLLGTTNGECQGKCDTILSCFGFSWERTSSRCRMWKESGLRGAPAHEKPCASCKCKVKVFDVVKEPVVPNGQYERMGGGKCLAGGGKDYPQSVYHTNVDEQFCSSRCSSSTECFGYTWSKSKKDCYMWELTDLRASENFKSNGDESCMMKVNKISQDTGAQSEAPPDAAPLIGFLDVGADVHAMKISIGRTVSSVPVSWNGQWKTLHPREGRCMTSLAEEPSHRIIQRVDSNACQRACEGDYSCNGYSWSNTGMCIVWMQPDLWGGGSKQGGFSCVIKQYAVLTTPVTSTGNFWMAGPGLCKTGWDTNPASAYLGKVKRSHCRQNCEGDSTCTGFSWQPSGECAAHFEAGLRSSRSTLAGNIACYVKDYKQVQGSVNDGQYANNAPKQLGGMNSFQQGPQGFNQQPLQQPPQQPYGNPQNGGYLNGGPSFTGIAGAAVGGTAAALGASNWPSNNNAAWPSGSSHGKYHHAGNNGNGNSGSNSGNAGSNSNNAPAPAGHSTAALVGASAVGAAGAMLGQHFLGGNKGGSSNTANSQPAQPQQRLQRHFTSESSDTSSREGSPFVFWTPNNTGSATCKSDMPGRGFPGHTPAQSNQAWPHGHQPRNLECWSKGVGNSLRACWYTKILFDTERGWPGKCEGLVEVDTGGVSCRESCVRNPKCAVWQETWPGNVCMQGRGRDCAGLRSGSRANIRSAQRLQHGDVRVLKPLKGMEVRGLRPDFNEKYFKIRREAEEACRNLCYSDIQCTYWVYSTAEGCFVEDPPMHTVPYPLTSKDINTQSDFARSVVAGEYILHRCPENDGTFTSEDEHAKLTLVPWHWNWFAFHWPWDKGGWGWMAWTIFAILSCCFCGCCFLFCALCGVCSVLKNRLGGDGERSKKKVAPTHRDSDSDSGSESSSSSSSSDGKRRYEHTSQKQALLNSQHLNSLAQGHGQQALHVHSSTALNTAARAGYR